jgi:hypothetical protein
VADEWLTVDEFCTERKLSRQTFYNWRLVGRAPRAYRFGKVLRIRGRDAAEWDEQHAEPERSA